MSKIINNINNEEKNFLKLTGLGILTVVAVILITNLI